uniref:Complement component 1, s subcomponent n=1 Tax=Monopterus albus TaxID=43700 RepID=A0A3Q3KRU5_MONAL
TFSLSLLLLLVSHSACSMLLGWVESPGYPKGYLPHASLNWSKCAPKGHVLSIRLIHLDLEDSQDCENDAVKVYSNGNLISVLCGKKEFEDLDFTVNPSLISSPGGCLSLNFYSDYSNTERHTGFRGFYSVHDFDECEDDPENGCTQFCHNFIGGYHCSCRHGYVLDADKHTCTVSCSEDLSGRYRGDISSPFWPASYAENSHCQYTLSVEAHLQLELHFSDSFDVEQRPDGQCIDTLLIKTHSGTLGPFCGHTPPPSPLLTHSHHVKIHFTSDGSGTNKGFTFHFKTSGTVCPAVVTSHSTATPQKPEYHQGQGVTVTCDTGYAVNTVTNKVLLLQNTGIWIPSFPCERVDCGLPEIPENSILKLVGSKRPHTQYQDQIQLKCSSKYYTLEGNDTYTCGASGDWATVHGKTQMPKCTPVCGRPEKDSASTGRILGGQDAQVGEIPWNLLIKEPSRGVASLINDQWAVTAAHVVEGAEQTSLRLYGGLVDGAAATGTGAVLDSERIIIHPGYTRRTVGEERTSYDNDIALIRLASRVNLGSNLLPICLPVESSSLQENEQGTISGWGLTERRTGTRLVTSRTLKYAHIGVYSLRNCQDTPYTPDNKRMIFTNNMFCAGADGKDSCLKDSGGPFVSPMLSADRGPYYLRGIVSWGAPCQQKKFKGYYTKVDNYVDWIRETIDNVETS